MSLLQIPAGHGRAVRLGAREALRIVNTHGHQVVDCWAFSAGDLAEAMSMEHTRAALSRVRPRVGDAFVTNRRRPILLLEEDSSPGIHDTLIAACDPGATRPSAMSATTATVATTFSSPWRRSGSPRPAARHPSICG
jgi:uncharacterized protein YcgI (DUF1989 family)